MVTHKSFFFSVKWTDEAQMSPDLSFLGSNLGGFGKEVLGKTIETIEVYKPKMIRVCMGENVMELG